MKRWLSLLMACVMALLSTALASEAADLSRMLEQGAAFAEQADYESAAMCYEIAVKLANDNLEALKGYAGTPSVIWKNIRRPCPIWIRPWKSRPQTRSSI